MNRVCASCSHTRCKGCPRYPIRKDPLVKEKEKKKELEEKENEKVVVGEVIEPDTYYGLRETIILTRPNPKTGGQPLVRKKPMQRVRRTCHECETLFAPGVKSCVTCSHVRCVDCPRDPYVFSSRVYKGFLFARDSVFFFFLLILSFVGVKEREKLTRE